MRVAAILVLDEHRHGGGHRGRSWQGGSAGVQARDEVAGTGSDTAQIGSKIGDRDLEPAVKADYYSKSESVLVAAALLAEIV